jgi:transposase-like protein
MSEGCMKENGRASKKCVVCGGVMYRKNGKFQGFPIDSYKCKNCGEEFFNPQQAERILEMNKTLNKVFEVVLGRIQSNLIVRIPVQVAETLDLKQGEKIKLEVENLNEICLKLPK